MACMAHSCKSCQEQWFDNNRIGVTCFACGSKDVFSIFDELPDEPDDDDDDWD